MTSPSQNTGHRARRRRGLALLVLVALTGACAASEPEPKALTPVRFGFIQAVDHLPFLVMQEQGFAERNGLRLEEEVVVGGPVALSKMSDGAMDVTYAGSLPLLAAARQGKVPGAVVAVGAGTYSDPAHPSMAVVIAPAIRSWKDLEGRTIGTNQVGSIGEVAMRIRLRAEGVSGVRFVEIPFPNLGLAVAGGNVAAAVMIEPFTSQSLLRGDGRVLDWVIGAAPFPEFIQTFIVVRAGLAREEPEVVQAYLRAHLEAVRWIEGHRAEARGILARRLGTDDRVSAAMGMVGFVADARIDPDLLGRMQATLATADPTQTPLPNERIYDEALLEGILGEKK